MRLYSINVAQLVVDTRRPSKLRMVKVNDLTACDTSSVGSARTGEKVGNQRRAAVGYRE